MAPVVPNGGLLRAFSGPGPEYVRVTPRQRPGWTAFLRAFKLDFHQWTGLHKGFQ